MNTLLFDEVITPFIMGTHVLYTIWAMTLPIYIVIAEYLGYKHNDPVYYAIAKRMTPVMVIFFSVGSAFGVMIAVSFLTLWYKWMYVVSQVDIMPLVVEVFAFFLETIFLALFVYGWGKFSRTSHLLLGIAVAIGANLSAALITMVNSWMNTPVGFNTKVFEETGKIVDVNPWASFIAPAIRYEVPMAITGAIYAATSLLMMFYGYRLFKVKDPGEREYYIKGAKLAVYMTAIDAPLVGLAGDYAGKSLAVEQPLKLAAMEGVTQSGYGLPEIVGPLKIPKLLSFLVTGNPNGYVIGLNAFPKSEWPPVFVVHNAFDAMAVFGIIIGIVSWLIAISLIFKPKNALFRILGLANGEPFDHFLPKVAMIVSGILGVLAWESGWVTAEVGRAPWIIYGVMTIAAAANTSPIVIPVGIGIGITIAFLTVLTYYLLNKVFKERPISVDIQNASEELSSMGITVSASFIKSSNVKALDNKKNGGLNK